MIGCQIILGEVIYPCVTSFDCSYLSLSQKLANQEINSTFDTDRNFYINTFHIRQNLDRYRMSELAHKLKFVIGLVCTALLYITCNIASLYDQFIHRFIYSIVRFIIILNCNPLYPSLGNFALKLPQLLYQKLWQVIKIIYAH